MIDVPHEPLRAWLTQHNEPLGVAISARALVVSHWLAKLDQSTDMGGWTTSGLVHGFDILEIGLLLGREPNMTDQCDLVLTCLYKIGLIAPSHFQPARGAIFAHKWDLDAARKVRRHVGGTDGSEWQDGYRYANIGNIHWHWGRGEEWHSALAVRSPVRER